MMSANSKRLDVFAIVSRENLEKDIFLRCGSAWINRDDSLNVYLDVAPLAGKLHIREPRPSERPE